MTPPRSEGVAGRSDRFESGTTSNEEFERGDVLMGLIAVVNCTNDESITFSLLLTARW